MNLSGFFILHLFLLLSQVESQPTASTDDGLSQDSSPSFQPSLPFVIGVLCIMFALTIFLLLYAKFCHRGGVAVHLDLQNRAGFVRSSSRYSGIDKTVIESLPFFRFSSLKGSKEGLECAVCLSKFEDIEMLRLLPKCKHAFHINCIDQWLEKHSSCPLCRYKVNAEDPTIFTYSNSMRLLGDPSELREDSNVELFIQREENRGGSSRFSIGGSFRIFGKGNKEEQSLIREQELVDERDCDNHKVLHKFNHRILMSGVVFKNRWSSVTSSDLMFLNSEMIHDVSSNRFTSLDSNAAQFMAERTTEDERIRKIKEEMEIKRLFETKVRSICKNPSSNLPSTSDSSGPTPRIIGSGDRRAVSEITALSRFKNMSIMGSNRESSPRLADREFESSNSRESSSIGSYVKEEKLRRVWLTIARRTVQWFVNRERRSQQTEIPNQALNV